MSQSEVESAPRCEGWRRHGGAFSLGPVSWHQCENPAIALLTVSQADKTDALPACQTCWNECIENHLEIIAARPLPALVEKP